MGRRSGPDAFEGFKLLFSMLGTVNKMSGIDETGSLSYLWEVIIWFSGEL